MRVRLAWEFRDQYVRARARLIGDDAEVQGKPGNPNRDPETGRLAPSTLVSAVSAKPPKLVTNAGVSGFNNGLKYCDLVPTVESPDQYERARPMVGQNRPADGVWRPGAEGPVTKG
jgi:hypothetical protein